VARVAPAGEVLLPATTKFGSVRMLDYKTGTDPVSGTSYVFDAAQGTFLSGHLRDGTILPGTEDGPKPVEANGMTTFIGGVPALGVASGALWVMWTQQADYASLDAAVGQRLDAAGDSVGDAVILDTPADDPSWMPHRYAVVPRSEGRAWFAGATGEALYGWEYDGGELGPPRMVVDNRGDPDTVGLAATGFILLEDEGGIWLSYTEDDPESLVPPRRVLRVKEGCVYESLDKMASGGW
jgi:hypothetical protein